MKIKKEFKIGTLVIVVLAVTFFLINFLRGSDIFGREITLVGHFDNVESLVESAPVHIRGFAAGKVTKVAYCPETDDFEVQCAVSKEFKIPSDSKMVIYSTSIMGSKGVRIDTGCASELATDGATIATASDMDLLSTLGANITPLLGKVSSAVDSLTALVANVNSVINEKNKASIQSSLERLNRTLGQAQALASSLNGKAPELENIITNLSALSEKLAPIAESANGTLENVNTITKNLSEADLKGTIDDIRKTVGTVNTTLEEVQQPLDSLLNNADTLIKEIQKNPKKYIKITIF